MFSTPSPLVCIFTQPPLLSFLNASAFGVPPSLCRHHMYKPPTDWVSMYVCSDVMWALDSIKLRSRISREGVREISEWRKHSFSFVRKKSVGLIPKNLGIGIDQLSTKN